MDVTWYVADLFTGQVLGELPLTVDGPITRRIATETSQVLTLPVWDDSCPASWNTLLVPGRTMIVLCLDDEPVQGWAVSEDLEVGAATVPINVKTLETCLARTNVGDYEPVETDDLAQVAATVVTPLVDRFGISIEWTECGTTRPDLAVYDSTVTQTVLAAINGLMAIEHGPEWRIYPRWSDTLTKRQFDKVLEISGRVGIDRPDAIFDLDEDSSGNIESYTRNSSFAQGKGATMVIGVSDGSDPTSPLVSDLVALGWPMWEERVTIPNVEDADDPDAALLAGARAALTQREKGGVVWKVTGNEDAPMPGRDYSEGDTVHVRVAPQGRQDPTGGTADTRVIGWEIDPNTGRVTPLLWDDADTDSDGDA